MASMAVGSDGWIADGKPTAVEEGRQAVAAAMVRAAALMPTWSRNVCAASGMCSLGLVLAEWRFRLLLLLNSLPQPGMVHMCISLRCTALVWIFSAPLSQNDLLHRSHRTRFFILLLLSGDSLSTLDSAESGRERASPTGGCSGEAEEVVTSTEGFTASSVACDFEEVSSSVAVVTDRESVA